MGYLIFIISYYGRSYSYFIDNSSYINHIGNNKKSLIFSLTEKIVSRKTWGMKKINSK
jgi:hypothetical protein